MTVPRAKARAAAVKPVANKQGSAVMASLLRHYVEGTPGKFDRRLPNKMQARHISKDAARRIVERLDSAGSSALGPVVGGASIRSNPGKRGLQQMVASVANKGSMMFLMPAITLPPENIPAPSTFSLTRVGLVTTATQDDDASDELTMFAIVATPDGNDYALNTVELGAGHSAGLGAQALGSDIYDGPPSAALIITALIEDDDGNATAAREEIEVLIGLAVSVASTMAGTDRLAVLQTMVDYTIALDGVGADPSRAARSVVATPMQQDEWFPLWSVDHSKTGGIDWKIAIPHSMGGGSYDLLLDIPGDVPPMKTVRLKVKNFALGPYTDPSGRDFTGLRLTAGIGSANHTFYLDATSGGGLQRVERKVVAGDVPVSLSAVSTHKKPFSQSLLDYCANAKTAYQRRRCKDKKKSNKYKTKKRTVDLSGDSGDSYSATFKTSLGGFPKAGDKKGGSKPSASAPTSPPKPLTTKSTKGKDDPWGSVTLRATLVGG